MARDDKLFLQMRDEFRCQIALHASTAGSLSDLIPRLKSDRLLDYPLPLNPQGLAPMSFRPFAVFGAFLIQVAACHAVGDIEWRHRAARAVARWPVKGMPTTLAADRQGRLALRAVGGREFDDPAIVAQLGELLVAKNPSPRTAET